jgi:hypothetical protein
MFVIPETPEDRKTMATKYDGVGPHRPGRGISEARPGRLARLYRDYRYAAGHEQKPFACNYHARALSTPFCWKIYTSTCKREW